MNESINKSIARGMALSLSGSTPVTEMSKYVLENALGRKVTMDGYATPAQVLRHLEEVKDEAAAKAAAEAAEHAKHHYEFSNALDSVGLAAVFHPEELKFHNPEISLHRGPNDDTLTHRYHEGAHQVALARRTGAGTRVGYGSHQNPRDALMMAIKDFNGKRAKGVNEDYEFDKSGKYITEASKSPNAVRMTSSVRQHLGGGMIVQTRNGKYYLLDPRATNGKLPHPGEEIDPSKHHYIGDGEWTPKHAEAVERINAALGKVPAIKAVDEAESLNELSKDTLLRYIRKSMRDAGNREVKAGRAYERFANNSSDSDSRKEFRAHELKSAMRQNGIALAARKLARGSVNEADSLNELSKDTLLRYIRHSLADAVGRSHMAGRDAVQGSNRSAMSSYHEMDKARSRMHGIEAAAKKLARKSVDEAASLDELSKDTLASYIRRASIDAATASYVAGRDAQFGGDDHGASARRGIARSIKRTMGIKKAADKLAATPKPATIEMLHRVSEAESLDELSSNTLASYIRKAAMDARQHEFHAGLVNGRTNNRMDTKSLARSARRQRGIGKASDKLVGRVNEAAPPDMEDWVKANKARFIKEYGDKKGHEVLYATAWKLHDKKANEDTLAESGTIEVIPHRVGITKDGKIVSPFSAGIDHIEKTGKWTWGVTDHNGNYTTGMSRTPVDSRAEAEKIAHDVSAKTGYKVNESTLDELHPETAKRYMHKAIRTAIQGKYDNDDAKRDKRFLGISRAAKRVRGDFHPGQDNSDGAVSESEQDNINHVKRMKAYHAAVKATDDASMAKVHFRMRHDISQPDNREAYNQLKRKHREARRAEAAAAEHVKGILFAKHALGEAELNELSPATVRSYLTKAIKDYGDDKSFTGYSLAAGKHRTSINKRVAAHADKRLKGIQRAIDNMGDDTQRNIKLPAGFGEGVDPGEVSPLFSNK